jgi:hypothetical protein
MRSHTFSERCLNPVFVFLLWACGVAAQAANMLPVPVTGFNRDVVVENTSSGPPYATAQNFNFGETTAFYQANLAGKTRGLPLAGLFTNSTDSTSFQLAPYTGNNALILSADTAVSSGTLFLTTPRVFDRIALIANSGNGDATGAGTLTLRFNDATTYVTNFYAPDWFNNNSGSLYTVALLGFQRMDLNNGGTSGGTTNPRFYQTTIDLTVVPGANKPLSSITFNKPNAVSTGIYALSGLTNSSQPALTFTPATVTNLAPTAITTTSATLNGQVLATGNDAPQITIFHGPFNGGTSPSAWSNSFSVGWQNGSFSQVVSGLAFTTTYFYTARAVNAGGTNWASPSRSFTTLTPSLAVLTNKTTTAITANSASLNGQVLSTGGDAPNVTLFYGPANGGTIPSAWSNSIALGIQSGGFGQGAFGLSPNTTYYWTSRATNGAGVSWGTPVQSFTTLLTNPPGAPVPVYTQHNDNSRTGRNLNETTLNAGNVNSNTFGLLYTRLVDDQIYAQPLIATNISVPGVGVRNLLLIATVNDSVYAYDADDASVTAPYWQSNYTGLIGGLTVTAPRNTDMTGACGGAYKDFSGSMGIVGTPAIDPVSKTMYFVARTREVLGVVTNFVQRLYAVDIATGANRLAPVVITGSYGGVTFDPQKNNQRAALTFANGHIFICWSSHCDWGPYHGWVMAYDAATLTQLAVYADTTTGSNGGIWMSGQGAAADANGDIYLSTGNGTVGANGNASDTTNRAMSFLKLNGTTLNIMSWFSPFNYNYLNGGDWDLGAGGLMLIPGTSLAIGGGKSSSSVPATLYVVNRDNMGGVSLGSSDNNIVQAIPVTPTGIGVNHIHGAPVWWDTVDGSYTYVWGESDKLHQYKFDPVNGVFFLPAVGLSPKPAWVNGMTGGMLAVSANGTNAGTGILWASHQFTGDANQAVRPGILHAYDAQNVNNELWNSEQNSARDSLGQYAKFVPPTVSNGKVYLATFSNRLNVYGLFGPGRPSIYQSPQPTTRFTGDTVVMTFPVGGLPPLSYQWKLNGINVPGATNPALVLPNVGFAAAGNYSCTVSNSYGPTNSAAAALTILTAPTVSYAQTVIADNPVGYWRLNETSGSVAHDSWGGHDGQFFNVSLGQFGYHTNDPDFAAGFGILAPSDSYVGNIQGIDFSTFGNNSAFTIEAWVKAGPQTMDAGVVTCGYGSGGEEFNLDTGGGSHAFRFSVRDSLNVAHNASGNVVPNNSWQHVVGVCDEPNGAVRLYVNGINNANTTIANGVQMGTDPVSIGSRRGGYATTYTSQFVGTIDEVAIYGYALNPTQILNHYMTGTNPVVSLYIQHTAPNATLIWSPGTLQSAPTVTGPYTDVSGASSPYTVAPANAQTYYRVKVR